jgi:acyl carrier protein
MNERNDQGFGKMIETIRRAIDERGHLAIPAHSLKPSADLYAAGLTPFAAIQVMLALEKALGVEFPKSMLNRRSMGSIDAILWCVAQLREEQSRLRAA